MKSIIKYVLPVLTGLFFVLAACEKEDIPYYSDVERINFDYTSMGLSKDTVNIAYGFVTDQYTNIDLELLLTGYAKDYDRVIGLTITSEDGAVAGTNYEIADNYLKRAEGNQFFCYKLFRECRIACFERLGKEFLRELKWQARC